MAGAWPHIKSGPPDWRACFFCFYVLETVKALSPPLQGRFCPRFLRASAESIGTHGPRLQVETTVCPCSYFLSVRLRLSKLLALSLSLGSFII
ncbi:hypothetical protein EDB87DRAFT_835457 [Lactarius vividus]|nr:hypothetical protein EDB87DRAFT_835457 [Lactarius vividus]